MRNCTRQRLEQRLRERRPHDDADDAHLWCRLVRIGPGQFEVELIEIENEFEFVVSHLKVVDVAGFKHAGDSGSLSHHMCVWLLVLRA